MTFKIKGNLHATLVEKWEEEDIPEKGADK